MKKRWLFLSALSVIIIFLGVWQSSKAFSESYKSWTNLGAKFFTPIYDDLLIEDNGEEVFRKINVEKMRNDEVKKNYLKKIMLEENKIEGVTAQVYQDKIPYLDDETIVKSISQSTKSKLYKLAEDNKEAIDSSIQKVEFQNKELYFEKFTLNNLPFITNKLFSDTPQILTNLKKTTFVFTYESEIYQVNPQTSVIEKLTKERLEGYTKEQYIEEYGGHFFWAINPAINAEGNQLIYFSNKSIDSAKISLENGLWLYSFEDGSEKRIISEKQFDNGASLYSIVNWVDQDSFIYTLLNKNGKYQYFLYKVSSEASKLIVECDREAVVENGYLVYRKDNNIIVHNLINSTINSYDVEKTSDENIISVSASGNIAIPSDKQIKIINQDTNLIETYMVPGTRPSYLIQKWISDNELLVYIESKNIGSSWVLSVGGGINE